MQWEKRVKSLHLGPKQLRPHFSLPPTAASASSGHHLAPESPQNPNCSSAQPLICPLHALLKTGAKTCVFGEKPLYRGAHCNR